MANPGLSAITDAKDLLTTKGSASKKTTQAIHLISKFLPFPVNIIVGLCAPLITLLIICVVAMTFSLTMSTVAAGSLVTSGSVGSVGNQGTDDINGAKGAVMSNEDMDLYRKALAEEGVDMRECTAITSPPLQPAYVGEAVSQDYPGAAPEPPPAGATPEVQRAYSEQVRHYNEQVKSWNARAQRYSAARPVWEHGQPVIGEQGEVVKEATALVDQVPEGTDATTAVVYMQVALAGGTSGWQHFARVVADEVPGGKVTEANSQAIADSFFTGGSTREYLPAAVASITPRLSTGSIRGDDSLVEQSFAPCLDK